MDVHREVEVVESCMVTPSKDTPSHGLWLSPLDLNMVNRGHTPTVYFYSSSSGVVDDFFDVTRLKVALAKALVAFYPLAGRLSVDGDGRAEINCAGQGVLFVVARSDLTVNSFVDFQPSPELRRLFVPRVEDSPSIMCAIQVTFMRCGGVTKGTALHHTAIDAVSAAHFFQTWSAFSRDGDGASGVAFELPCHDRTLLRARSPPVVHPDALTVLCPKLSQSEPSAPAVNEIFLVSSDQVAALKRACAGSGDGGGGRVSTFCAVGAHVWRSMCAARRLPPDATTRLTFPASGRRSMRPPLPPGYCGNGIIWLGAAGKVRDVTSSESEDLAFVAGQISSAVRRMDDELVRSAIDYFELTEINSKPAPGRMPETELRVISWLGMPVYDVDFGWGKPCRVDMVSIEMTPGTVSLAESPDGLGGVEVGGAAASS